MPQRPSLLLSKVHALERHRALHSTPARHYTDIVTLTDVVIDDAQLGISGLAVTPSTLPPGQTGTATFTDYAPTQAELDAGEVVNTATATGTDPDNNDVTGSDTEITPVAQNPGIELDKQVTSAGPYEVGVDIEYTFTVTNTGDVTLTDVVVNDPLLGGTVSCSPATLAPSDTASCGPETYTITRADVDNGGVTNTATVTGKDPNDNDVTDSDSTSTELDRDPAIELVKEVISTGDYGLDDEIEYRITATNTGNVTLFDVEISDPLLGALGCDPSQPADLTPGEELVCEGSYTVTQDDVDAGEVVNSATVDAKDPEDNDVPEEDEVTTPVDQNPAISLNKAVTSSGPYTVGSDIEYTFTVENTGDVTLTNIEVDDPLLGGAISCSPATLAPGATATCGPVLYTVTQTDVNNGFVFNEATVTGEDPSGDPVEDSDETNTGLDQNPAIALDKQVVSDGPYGLGDTISYEITATNTGDVDLYSVVVEDVLLTPSTATCATVAPNDTCVLTGTYAVTQDDVDAGEVHNVATVDAEDPSGSNVPGEDEVTTPVTQNPGIELDKQVISSGPYEVDADIDYSFTVTNTGDVTLTDVVVNDPLLGGEISCSPATLAPSDAASCGPETYTITQADVDNGGVTNTATVTGKDPNDNDVTDSDSTTTEIHRHPDIELVKEVVSTGDYGLDDEIEYRITATNTGNVTLFDVEISAPLLGALDCDPSQPADLAPGEELVCEGSYTVTQADVDAGEVVNSATVDAKDPEDNDVPEETEITTPVAQNPAISLDKAVTSSGPYTVGSDIEYTFTVENTGDVTLTNIEVDDPLLGGAISCSPATLAPSDTATCGPVNYTVTQTDVNNGFVFNEATVTGKDPDDNDVTDEAETNTGLDQNPAIALDKQVVSDGPYGLGDTISYEITATNTGDVDLYNVVVEDVLLTPSTATCATVAPTDSCVLSGTYTVTQDDVDAGEVHNVATVDAEDPEGNNVPGEDEVTTPIDQTPGISLDKRVTSSAPFDVGDDIDYEITATNTGNVTLFGVEISDPLLGALDCDPSQPADLAPGEELVCEGSYTVTQNDVDAGEIINVATVNAEDPEDNDVPEEDEVTTPVDQNPAISLNKTVTSAGPYWLGDAIDYEITATISLHVALSVVEISDPLLGALDCNPSQPTDLAPGDELVCEGSYTVTQTDVNNGFVFNEATVTGKDPDDNDVTDEAETNTGLDQNPASALDKQVVSDGPYGLGDTIEYTITATNIGDVDLYNVVVSDPQLNPSSETCSVLAPTDSCVLSGTYTVTQDDVDAGEVHNAATVDAEDPEGNNVPGEDEVTTPIDQTPGISLDKRVTSSAPFDVGDNIDYEITAINTGNVTLFDVEISDPLLGALDCAPAQPADLAPGDELVCEGSYTVTQDDVNDGEVVNTATVSGSDPNDDPVEAEDSITTPVDQAPAIELVKSVTTSGPYWIGDTITYEFTVENTGNVPLTDVEVDDPLLGGIIACLPDALDPGETASCGPVDYTVTSADVSAGEVVNTATAYGTPPVTDPSDPPVEVSADDTVNTPISGKPPIPVPAFGWGGLLILLTAFSLVGWRRLRA